MYLHILYFLTNNKYIVLRIIVLSNVLNEYLQQEVHGNVEYLLMTHIKVFIYNYIVYL